MRCNANANKNLQDVGPVHLGLTCVVQYATKDDTILRCVPGSFKNS
jgi:hypothetical protein